jgi:hypothetical protein
VVHHRGLEFAEERGSDRAAGHAKTVAAQNRPSIGFE